MEALIQRLFEVANQLTAQQHKKLDKFDEEYVKRNLEVALGRAVSALRIYELSDKVF